MCTNGVLPNNLPVDEISVLSTNSPAFATFSNIKPVIRSACPALGQNHLWKQFSLRGLNLHLLNLKALRSLLEMHILSDCRDYLEVKDEKRRLEGIVDLKINTTDRLNGRSILRGWDIRIKLNRECYSSEGDLYLFGAMLDRFMALFATQATFTQTVIEDVQGKREYRWTERTGKRALL